MTEDPLKLPLKERLRRFRIKKSITASFQYKTFRDTLWNTGWFILGIAVGATIFKYVG